MEFNFMDMGLNRVVNFPVYTLGPPGTSSEFASQYFCNRMNQNYQQRRHRINLMPTYEAARDQVKNQHGVMVVANAYASINDFYMDPNLELLATFVFDTPLYGLAVKQEVPDRELRVASHPAPIPLIEELIPDGLQVSEIIRMTSTSAAAKAVVNNEVDMALTTEIAAGLHKLRFISRIRPIHMLWSVFGYSVDDEVKSTQSPDSPGDIDTRGEMVC
ncbi:prephenate dehydratase [Vibrio aerogenes CECT 7868]|uniref:Prephenate dehydratase n=1 Tax=Vibrio aerogenes CECT 7868 TaxID=1216006 RepID=A0A1M5UXB2_9VIBR|nr:bacilysin biosynthesis protein BacA [Vibrio aerogenes]SHH67528.1 prephenate dehydratase [Vibrio aerogenes CECT 7868]